MKNTFLRRSCPRLGIALVLLLSLLSCSRPREQKKPNVVFLFIDQYRADIIGAYGGGKNISTPNIDRLAQQGALCSNGISTTPLCTPYRGMLLTGRYPTHSGIILNWTEVNPDQRSIAHVFRDGGYQTGYIGKWHLAAGEKKKNGKHMATKEDEEAVKANNAAYLKENPEPEYVPPGPSRMGYDHWEAYNFHAAFNHYYFYRDSPKRIEQPGYETDIQIDQAINFMKKQQMAGQPFFLVVAPHPPHPPFRPEWTPAGYLDKVPQQLEWSPNVPEDHPLRTDQLAARCYFAMAKNADDNVGRLMDFMETSGLSKDTILVLTSDHGTMLGSHGRRDKMVPYAEAMNIPLIVRWPGHIPAGSRVDTIYTPLDHLPTLSALAGLKAPAEVDGIDLSAALLGQGKVERESVLIANYTSHWDYFDSGTNWPEWRGVRTERYTYAKWLKGGEELYDNLDDPYQMNNLANDPAHRETLEKLRSQMNAFLARAHDDFLPGTAYAEWFDDERNLLKTALGPVRH